MTDAGSSPTYSKHTPARRSTRGVTVRVAALAGAATLAVGGALAVQMARGADPALGPKTAASAQPRKKVVTTVVVRKVPAPATGSGTASSSASTPTYSYAPAPTPAPAPAPVVSSTS